MIRRLSCGGTGSRLFAFSQALDRATFEQIIVVINRPDGAIDRDLLTRYAAEGIEVIDFGETDEGITRWTYVPRKIAVVLRVLWKVGVIIRERRIDLLDCYVDLPGFIGFLAARVFGKRIAVTLFHPPQELIWGFVGRVCTGLADLVITDSLVRAEELKRWKLGSRPNLCVLPSGIVRPPVERSRTAMLGEFRLPSGPLRIVGTIGRFHPSKGQRHLLRSARAVLNTEPATYFLIVGYCFQGADHRYREQLVREAGLLGIADHVRFMEYEGSIGDVWQLIDVHVHPTLFDSLPIAVIEGMSFAKPAIVTAVGGIPELVVDQQTGLVVPPADEDALSSAICSLLRNPGRAASLGTAASRRYEECYGVEMRTRELEKLFLNAVERRDGVGEHALLRPVNEDPPGNIEFQEEQ